MNLDKAPYVISAIKRIKAKATDDTRITVDLDCLPPILPASFIRHGLKNPEMQRIFGPKFC